MLIELSTRGQIQRLPVQEVERIGLMTGFRRPPQAFSEAIRGVVRHNVSLGGGLFFQIEDAYYDPEKTLYIASLGYTADDARSLKRLERCMSIFDAKLRLEALPHQHPYAFSHSRGVLVTYPQRI